MDPKAYTSMNYALCLLSAAADGKRHGCIINSFHQVTSSYPPKFTIAVYKSGRVGDKFASYDCKTDGAGSPYLTEHMVSRVSCKVVDSLEIGSYVLFVGQAVEAEVLSGGAVLTLKDFTDRGKATPASATVYRSVEVNGYRCSVCGYVYEGEGLPADFRCPLCKAPAEKFEKIDK